MRFVQSCLFANSCVCSAGFIAAKWLHCENLDTLPCWEITQGRVSVDIQVVDMAE